MGCSYNAHMTVSCPVTSEDFIKQESVKVRGCGHPNPSEQPFCGSCGQPYEVTETRDVWATPELIEAFGADYEEPMLTRVKTPEGMTLISDGEGDNTWFGITLSSTGDMNEGGDEGHTDPHDCGTLLDLRSQVRTCLARLGLDKLAAQVDLRLIGYVSC